jgi:hypothetical protein
MEKEPKDRIASAEGLRLALERWAATAGGMASHREIAALIADRCGAEIASRRAQIQAARSRLAASRGEPTPAPARSFRKRHLLAAVLVTLVAVVLVNGLASAGLRESGHRAETAPAVASSSVATCPTAAATETAPDAALQTTEAEADAGAPRTVTLHVHPARARLLFDGEPMALDAKGGAILGRAAPGEMRVGILKAEGHVDRIFSVDDDTSAALDITLTPNAPALLTSR